MAASRRPWPRYIRVGFKRFSVVVDNQRTDDHDAHAICFTGAQEIVLRDDRGPDTTACDVLHESMHACFDVAQLDGEKLKAADDPEEEFVHRMAPVLLQLLRDNPGLVAYLTGRGA